MVTFEKFSTALNRHVETLLFVLGFSMAVVVAVQVFFRYVLNQSLFWSEELARFMLVWLTFLGASVAYKRGSHPGIDMLYKRMPPAVRKASALLVHTVSMGLFVVMIVYGYQFSYFVRRQISPALYLPKWIIFSVIPVSGAIFLIHAVGFLLHELRGTPHDG